MPIHCKNSDLPWFSLEGLSISYARLNIPVLNL